MAAKTEEIMELLELAYDAYAEARFQHGNAEADHKRVYLQALAKSKLPSDAAKRTEAEVAASDQKQALIRAETMSEITSTHVRVLLGELVAAQSVAKYTAGADGTWS